MSPPVVRAAGGVILRDGEVLLIRREKYADWTFPKGKVEPGETDEECALREVEEETGLCCELGAELSTTQYTDSRGRAKQVRYWLMCVVSGAVAARPGEIDEARWVTMAEATAVLTYGRDRALLHLLPASKSQ